MSILKIQTEFAGEVGVSPRLVRIVSDDDYNTIVSANYLKSVENMGYSFYPTDFIAISYSNGFSWFQPSISGSTITLTTMPIPAAISGSVTDGDFAVFNGNTGVIKDAGYLPSDSTKTRVSMASGSTVVNNFAKFADVHGTVSDAGARIISGTTGTYAGGGTSNTFSVTGLSSSCVGSAVIRASTNSVSITKALPGTNTLAITFSADPGANTTVDYIYTTAAMS